jgi:nucleotide-binding universal stress UspA family protein
MAMYTDILVVADGTDTAVSHAVEVSDAFDAKLHALYAFDPSEADVLSEKERAGAVERAETAGTEETGRVAELAAERGIDTARAVREGVPHRTVVGYAKEKGIDLVVVRDPGADAVSSNLPTRAMRLSEVPVMTAPDGAEADGYDSIVVPTDGSDPAVNAAEHAVALAEVYDADVHAVYVVKSAVHDHEDAPRSTVGLLKEAGKNATEEVVSLAEEAGVSATRAVVKGTPHEEILRHAEDFEADLVSMGKLGPGADERGFVGSTTERVLHRSDLPVLSVG